MKLIPLNDRIIVKKVVKETKTAGGLVLPDMSKKDVPAEGKVLAVGIGSLDPKGERKPIGVEVGNTILFAAHSGIHVKVDGEEYTILSEKDLLAKIEE